MILDAAERFTARQASVLSENAKKAIKGTLRENGKLILNLSNRDLSNMLEYELNGNLASEYLYNVLDEMLIELEK